MKPGKASRTAEYAAGFRAIESVRRPAASRLFEDPFAVHFIAPDLQRIVRWAAIPVLGGLVRWYVDRLSPGAMTSGIARTRLIDDLLGTAVHEGFRRVMILGAGYDARAHRMPELACCRVVEVDHPATLASKQERLRGLLPGQPGHVAYVGADLTGRDLRDVWKEAGLGSDERTFILWEGVTHYLGEAAVDAVLRALSEMAAPGSRLLFTYLHGGLLDGSVTFEMAHIPMKRVASEGEPWIWGMRPDRLPDYLARRGFGLLSDVGADEYRVRYWGERGRRMRGFAFYRVALTVVRG